MDEVTWVALTATLTVVFGVGSWLLYQRRGLAAGLKGAGLTLLPAAAYLTDTLRMFTRIGTAVGDWATGLVFSPTVWLGVVLAGIAALLGFSGRALGARGGGGKREQASADERAPSDRETGRVKGRENREINEASSEQQGGEEGLDDIEEILKRRGIT